MKRLGTPSDRDQFEKGCVGLATLRCDGHPLRAGTKCFETLLDAIHYAESLDAKLGRGIGGKTAIIVAVQFNGWRAKDLITSPEPPPEGFEEHYIDWNRIDTSGEYN